MSLGSNEVDIAIIKKWKAKNARILFALPTGQLASSIRAVHPDIDVDTSCGAFLFHRPLSEALAILSQYDIVVIDEISMLTAKQFDRLIAMWNAIERTCCIILLGDFWQLPIIGKDHERCELSDNWLKNLRVT